MGEEFGIKQGPDSGVNDPKYILADFSLDPEYSDALSPYNFQINNRDPVLLNLNRTTPWPSQQVAIPENYGDDDWVRIDIPIMHAKLMR